MIFDDPTFLTCRCIKINKPPRSEVKVCMKVSEPDKVSSFNFIEHIITHFKTNTAGHI